MKRLFLILLLSACATNRQEPTPVPPVIIQRIMPFGPRVGGLWELAKECAGPARDTTKTLEEVKWFRRSRIRLPVGMLLGQWVPPDTIFVTERFDRDPWVVAHELLHHALNGPPLPADSLDWPMFEPHPQEFARCGLAIHPSDIPMFLP